MKGDPNPSVPNDLFDPNPDQKQLPSLYEP